MNVGERSTEGATGLASPDAGSTSWAVARRLRRTARARASELRSGSLERNALLIMATTVVNSAFGALYWIVIARVLSPSDLGIASALVSAMTIASLASNLGSGTTLIERLPGRASGAPWSRTLTAAAVVGTAGGLVAGAACALLLPRVTEELSGLTESPGRALVLVATVPAWTLTQVFDYAFIAERRADLMLIRNAVFSVGKIVVLAAPLLLGGGGYAVFASWGATTAGVMVGSAVVLLPRLKRRWGPEFTGFRQEVRCLTRSLVGHHVINVAGASTIYLLPLLVTARSSAAENGYFYVTWMVGNLFLIVSASVAGSLFAEGSHDAGGLRRHSWTAFKLIGVFLVPLSLVYILLGHQLLGIFGDRYSEEGFGLLMLLLLSGVPDAVTNLAISVFRVQRRIGLAICVNVLIAVTTLALAWILLPHHGLVGVGYAWLAGQALGCAFVAAVAVLDRVWGRRDSAPVALSESSPTP